MNVPFIVLEGLDGVGKTTCGRLLADQLNGTYISTPTAPFRSLCSTIDSLQNWLVRFHFFLSTIFEASSDIKTLLETGPVVCDRYVYTTFAYHRVLGVDTNHVDFVKLPIIWPNYSFLLNASEEVRLNRLSGRGLTNWDKKFTNPEWRNGVQKEFETFGLTPLDTTNLSPPEIVNMILKSL